MLCLVHALVASLEASSSLPVVPRSLQQHSMASGWLASAPSRKFDRYVVMSSELTYPLLKRCPKRCAHPNIRRRSPEKTVPHLTVSRSCFNAVMSSKVMSNQWICNNHHHVTVIMLYNYHHHYDYDATNIIA